MAFRKRKKHNACPSCGSADQVPILYGLPTDESFQLASQGKLALGGCIVWDDSPQWSCRKCGTQWGGSRVITPEAP
jgi:hypothetical protein